jgi:hypothetical protein
MISFGLVSHRCQMAIDYSPEESVVIGFVYIKSTEYVLLPRVKYEEYRRDDADKSH